MNILLIEDNLAEARLLQEVLKGAIVSRFNLAHVKRLGEAIAALKTETFDVVLLDLTLPDSEGLASLDSLIQHAPSLPVVVLTNTNDDELAIESVVVTRGGRPLASQIVSLALGSEGTDALLDANGAFVTRVPAPGRWLLSALGSPLHAAAGCDVPPGGLEGCRIDLAVAEEEQP